MKALIKGIAIGTLIILACFYFSEAHSEDSKSFTPIHFTKNADGSITIPAADAARFIKGLQTVFIDNAIFANMIEQLTKKNESMKCV